MTVKSTILVVDDEETIREVVRRYLERDGYLVKEAADGYEALRIIQDDNPALIVLDLMLPGIDGLSLTQHLRLDRQIPIIMLTAKSEDSDRIRGLDLGADDYITKPFNPQEVVSRVRAVLRRIEGSKPAPAQQAILAGGIKIDPVARQVEVEGQDITLTAKEFDLLLYFVQNPQQVFTRSQLLAQIWGDELYTDPSTVTVHIRRLREKIESIPGSPEYILTVWGVGYKFAGKK
ncbi:MAG: response regulator transcription factor [Chloroflexi bacterium]|nr:response regulator transcription factor [Chloroflexota bacterium]